MPDATNPEREPPGVSQEPLLSNHPPETQADRESVAFGWPDWIVDRVSATALMLVIVVILLAVGGFLISFVTKFPFWGN